MVGAARGPPRPAPALRTAASRKRILTVLETNTRRPGTGDSPSRKRDSPSRKRGLTPARRTTHPGELHNSPGWIVRLTGVDRTTHPASAGGVEAGAPGRVELGELATPRQELRGRAVLHHPAVGHDE